MGAPGRLCERPVLGVLEEEEDDEVDADGAGPAVADGESVESRRSSLMKGESRRVGTAPGMAHMVVPESTRAVSRLLARTRTEGGGGVLIVGAMGCGG